MIERKDNLSKKTKVIQISYTDISIDEGYISKEMCKQDEREFLSDFDICNKADSIGNCDKNYDVIINVNNITIQNCELLI